MMKCKLRGLILCFLLCNFTTGNSTSCLSCVCAYNEDLSGIRDSQTRFSLYGLITSYCTQHGCRTAGAEDTGLISNCSSNTQSKKIPVCVVCDGILTFSSKSAPDETFSTTIIYRGCAAVDSSDVTSCYQYTKTDWRTLPLFSKISTFEEASSAGFYSGSVCYNALPTYSEGRSVHQNCKYFETVLLFVLNALVSRMLNNSI